MKIKSSAIRATHVALIYFLFTTNIVFGQWQWHGHPQIGFIYDFEIENDTLFLIRAQFEHDINNFTESLIKLDLEGKIISNDSLYLYLNHPNINSTMCILEDFIVLNNYNLSEWKPNQRLIKYYFEKSNSVLSKSIEVGIDHGAYWSTLQLLNDSNNEREVNFGIHYRYDDVSAKDGELLFQFWSPNLGLEHEDRYEIEDKEGNSVPTPVDLIATDFGYIGAAFYKSKSRNFVFPESTDTVFANRSHLYCYDHEGNLFDVKELGEDLYQERPQFYFNVNQIITDNEGYYVVGSLEIGGTLVYMKLDENLNIEWVHDMWSQDTTEFAFFDPSNKIHLISRRSYLYCRVGGCIRRPWG